LPYIIPVSGLPEEVGNTYQGATLFSIDENGKYVANYEESMDILEYIFPKNKNIFLMCGGGGYAGMTKELLINLGWSENKIYNVGGYWYYDGKNNVNVKETVDGKDYYNFAIVPYHNIDFSLLHKVEASN
jgi:rhodanese-related sulfurtransferase